MKSGRHKPVRFFFIHFCNISCGYTFPAARAENGAMIKRKVYRTVYDPAVVHFYEVALANLLVIRDETITMSAAHFKDMASPYFYTIRVFINLHIYSPIIFIRTRLFLLPSNSP